MATPDQIPSDLTLEVEMNLSPDKFMAVARAFFGYVEEIGKAISPDGSAPEWVVRVKEGSSLIGLDPIPSAHIEVVRAVYTKAEFGITCLSRGDLAAASLTDGALKHLRVLSDATEDGKRRRIPIRLWVNKRPTDVGKNIADAIREDWRADYYDYGSVEGKLDAIQDRGGLQLTVRDQFLRQAVRCIVPEDLLKEALENFRQRVEVFGTVHYHKNGKPVSIEVARIVLLPDDSTLPSLTDVRGILRYDA